VLKNHKKNNLSCIIIPQKLQGQSYIEQQQAIILKLYPKIKIKYYKNLKSLINIFLKNRLKRIDFILINWYENKLLVSQNERRLSIFSVLRALIFFLFLRIISRQLIYVKHNNYPHDLLPVHIKYSVFITKMFELFSNSVVCHSEAPMYKKYSYVPHPLPKDLDFAKENLEHSEYFCIFGRILRYKGIHDIISAWDTEQKLLIVGYVEDNIYLEELILLAKKKNIFFITKFVEQKILNQIIRNSKACIFCHNKGDMIVSGGVYHAIALRRPIFAICSPHLQSLKDNYELKSLQLFKDVAQLIKRIKSEKPQLHFVDDKFFKIYNEDYIKDLWKKALQ